MFLDKSTLMKIPLIYYLFCYFKLNDFSFKYVGKNIINTGWCEATSYFKIKLPVKNIYASIKKDGNISNKNILETPHYSFVSSNQGKQDYFDYKEKNFNLEKKDVEKKFNDLITSVMNDGLKNNILIEKNIDLINKKEAKILDGVHRSAVLLSLGKDNIECFIEQNKTKAIKNK